MSGRYGGGAKCPVCTKTVYFAEEVVAAGQKWHKACCKCSDCNKLLDSTTMAEHEGKLFCHSCHKRGFGLKGYGYGQGAGVLASETGDQQDGGATGHATGTTGYASYLSGGSKPAGGGSSKYGGSNACPRCGKAVYMAEKIVGAGKAWHKGCFSCASCNKKLDSTTVTDNEGEIYCKGCYGKQFGPKGFGFGQGAGTLTMT